jgi:hypothetical protein
MVIAKACAAFLHHHQDVSGTSVLYHLVTIYFNVQENCLEDLKTAKNSILSNLFFAIIS